MGDGEQYQVLRLVLVVAGYGPAIVMEASLDSILPQDVQTALSSLCSRSWARTRWSPHRSVGLHGDLPPAAWSAALWVDASYLRYVSVRECEDVVSHVHETQFWVRR